MAMDLDDGGVDHGVFHVRRVGAGVEKPCKNARLDPVAVALENSVPVAEERRKITPRASRPHDPKDSFDKATVVASAAPGVRRLTQTMRLHLRPLGVRQYESFHLKLESQPSLKWNPDSQQALDTSVVIFQQALGTGVMEFAANTLGDRYKLTPKRPIRSSSSLFRSASLRSDSLVTSLIHFLHLLGSCSAIHLIASSPVGRE